MEWGILVFLSFAVVMFLFAFRQRWRSNKLGQAADETQAALLMPVIVHEMMHEHIFWRIINNSKTYQGDAEQQSTKLKRLLNNLSILEIVAFDKRFHFYKDQLFRWDVWGALYLFNGGCSDDSFSHFRAWLIGQGQQKFASVLRDPEAIIDFVSANEKWEGLEECAPEVYGSKTGDTLLGPIWQSDQSTDENLELVGPKDEPAGEEWTAVDLPHQFPRIAKLIASRK
jgi:hypothetical protein